MLPEYEWLPAAASGGALLLLLLWTARYLRVMAPKAGTLEWIRRTERGRFSPFYLQPVRLGGYLLLAAIFLCGLAHGVIGTEYRMNDWFPAASNALPAVIAALMLLRLFGAVLPSSCGTVLLALVLFRSFCCCSPPCASSFCAREHASPRCCFCFPMCCCT